MLRNPRARPNAAPRRFQARVFGVGLLVAMVPPLPVFWPGLALATLPLVAGGCRSSTAGVDAGAGDDAGGDASAFDAGENDCNGLSQVGPAVTATCAAGAAPAALGGTVLDGTYVLTATVLFGTCALPDLSETLVISQGTVESLATSADGTVTRKSLTYEIPQPGTLLVETQTCPSGLIANIRYSATPTTLTIYLTNALTTRVSTFTRL
jgi:hypothetical protein